MRSIKFRAWDGEQMHNEVWMNFECPAILVDNDVIWFVPKAIMQFTGMLDKNGVEIYEGDIVEGKFTRKPDRATAIVKWDDKRACFIADILGKNEFHRFNDEKHPRGLTIFGNIYENPELLTNKEK